MTEQPDKEFERWAREHNEGNLNSPTTRQLYEHRHFTVEEYIAKFRKGRIIRVLPAEARTLSVEQALKTETVGGKNIRKLLKQYSGQFWERSRKACRVSVCSIRLFFASQPPELTCKKMMPIGSDPCWMVVLGSKKCPDYC